MNIIDVIWRSQAGEWQVTTGETRIPVSFTRKSDAVKAAKDKALAAGWGVVRVHGTDGLVQKEHHYGAKPYDTLG